MISMKKAPLFLKTACVVFGGLFLCSQSLASTDKASAKAELSQINSQIQQAKTKQQEISKQVKQTETEILNVRKKMVSAASSIQEQEDSLNKLENKLHEFEERQKLMKRYLGKRKSQRIYVLAALQNLAWKPTEALLMQPLPPTDTLRSALLLRETVPRIEYSAKGLRKDLLKVASLTSAIRAQYKQIKQMTQRLEAKHKDMNVLIKKKTDLQKQLTTEGNQQKERAEMLAKQANDLKDLLAKLEEESKLRKLKLKAPAETTGKFMAAKGKIPFPAKGKIIKKYGDITEAGSPSKGIVIQTRPGAQVISPFDGTVLFAGPFRGYGELVIIEHDDGYHTLLAGLGRLDTTVGQNLLVGEPIGIMLAESQQTLYIELRKDGQPVNPSGFMKDESKG